MRLLLSAIAAVLVCPAPLAVAAAPSDPGELPRMDWDRYIVCTKKPDGTPMRLQCTDPKEDTARVCLFSSACIKGTKGGGCRPLERTRICALANKGFTWEDRAAAGYTFVESIAEAPDGWYRDTDGEVFQINFDLNRRLWLGSGWAMGVGPGGRRDLAQMTFEAGLRAEFLSNDLTSRYRIYVLDSDLRLNPLSLEATLFRHDSSSDDGTPFLRITTFIPKPERHDLYLNVGWWSELVGVEVNPRGFKGHTNLRTIALGLTWDLWHSPDMSSFARLRSGASVDALFAPGSQDAQIAFTPMAYLEGDWTLDRGGFHHIQASSGFEGLLVFDRPIAEGLTVRHRFTNELSYEVIFLAINDQPVTVRAHIGGGFRDDLIAAANGWDFNAGVSLRTNIWAPPRDLGAMDEASRRFEGRQ